MPPPVTPATPEAGRHAGRPALVGLRLVRAVKRGIDFGRVQHLCVPLQVARASGKARRRFPVYTPACAAYAGVVHNVASCFRKSRMININRYTKFAAPLMLLVLLSACAALIGPRQVELPQAGV